MPDHNLKLREAVYSTGLECSEEPMRKELQGASYAVWNKSMERTLYASGKPIIKLTRYVIEAYLVMGENAQARADAIKGALAEHGFLSVRQTSSSYDALINRRVVSVTATIREELL